MKVIVYLNDPLWTDSALFSFVIPQINSGTPFIELSEINSEDYVASNTLNFTSTPYAIIKCIKPGYQTSDLIPDPSQSYTNDISFQVQPPPAQGYSNTQYLEAINTGISKIQTWGITIGNVTNPFSINNNALFTFSINHVIPQIDEIDPTKSNFIVDLSGTFLKEFITGSKDKLVFPSATQQFDISNLNISSYATITNQNNKIYKYNNIEKTSTLIIDNNDINRNYIKIDTYRTPENTFVVLSSLNVLYYYSNGVFQEVIFLIPISNYTIIDFSCGNNHTLVLTTNGIWSFGSNENNVGLILRWLLAQLLVYQSFEYNLYQRIALDVVLLLC